MRLALIIEYEGTRYHGFQAQANAPSIQGELEKAIEKLTGEKARVKGAGRTDAGVHALGQVVAFDTQTNYTIDTFVNALKFYLPDDIAVREAYGVRDSFDPRREALCREYQYTILNSPTPSPLLRRFACHIKEPLDTKVMQEASRHLEGEHDFSAFSSLLPAEKSPRRRVYKAQVRREGNKVLCDIAGNAFLPHQVRRMAGALVKIGLGKMDVKEFQDMLHWGKKVTGPLALPANGLCLIGVYYKDFPPKAGMQNDNGV